MRRIFDGAAIVQAHAPRKCSGISDELELVDACGVSVWRQEGPQSGSAVSTLWASLRMTANPALDRRRSRGPIVRCAEDRAAAWGESLTNRDEVFVGRRNTIEQLKARHKGERTMGKRRGECVADPEVDEIRPPERHGKRPLIVDDSNTPSRISDLAGTKCTRRQLEHRKVHINAQNEPFFAVSQFE